MHGAVESLKHDLCGGLRTGPCEYSRCSIRITVEVYGCEHAA